MNKVSRRQVLKCAAGMAGAFGVPYLIPSGVLAADGKPGANERVAVGAIGVGGRASLLLDQLPKDGQIVALCDCNLPRAEAFKAQRRGDWPVYQHYDKILERQDIDAVIIATQEFQRVLPSIHACQAGKDVYAEKPLTLYVREGRVLVDTVRKHGRIFQVGSQQRSMAMNRIACELVRTGGLGKILEVQAPCYPGAGESHGRWGGGGRDFAGGEMTNWGAHGVDQIQWALGADGTGPVEMWPATEGPNGKVEMRYANGVPVRFVLDHGPWGGAIFVCEQGKLEVNRNKFTSNPKDIAVELLKKVDEAEEERKWSDQTALWQAQWHLQNWIDCIRTRQLPTADVEIGHRSISVCHLANITRWVGRRLTWDPVREVFLNDEEANRFADRPRRKGYELPTSA
ncbi:MAG: Gfo/Idh/MocA family oxidoreductase [Pirellulaceae bacterium]|nr:Gfo/Idh/MocA family oxidoreductase [Pirellulaceae bacterium]